MQFMNNTNRRGLCGKPDICRFLFIASAADYISRFGLSQNKDKLSTFTSHQTTFLKLSFQKLLPYYLFWYICQQPHCCNSYLPSFIVVVSRRDSREAVRLASKAFGGGGSERQ
jgi:hypothetical protein